MRYITRGRRSPIAFDDIAAWVLKPNAFGDFDAWVLKPNAFGDFDAWVLKPNAFGDFDAWVLKPNPPDDFTAWADRVLVPASTLEASPKNCNGSFSGHLRCRRLLWGRRGTRPECPAQ